MKFILQVIAIFILAYVLELFLPWYCIAIVAFVIGYIVKSKANFLAGFLAIALLWSFKAWMIDSAAASDFIEKVAAIFSLKQKSYLFLVTAFVGGLIGGFAALTGSLLRSEKRKSYY